MMEMHLILQQNFLQYKQYVAVSIMKLSPQKQMLLH